MKQTGILLGFIGWLVSPLWGWSLAMDGSGYGTPFDLQGFVDQKVQEGNRRIVIPPGRYRVEPRNRQHLVLRGLKDTEIIADGVEMICTETTRAVTIVQCTNLSLRGLAIDYDPLPFTQGRIVGLSADKTLHEIELFAGYPPAEAARNFKYEIFRPDTRTLRTDDRYPTKVEAIDIRRLRITNPRGKPGDPEELGDLIVIGAEYAPHGSIPHAVYGDGNTNLRLDNINLYASNCFGFLETNCQGSVYYRCRIDRRPAANEPMKRADPRLRSLDADAFHSKHAVKGPSYIECSARFMGDDCINICGDYHLIMSSQGRNLRVLAKGNMNIQEGDPLELTMYDGRRLPDARAVAVQPAGGIHDQERAWLLKQRMDERLRKANGALNRAYTITLDRDVDLSLGSVVCAANRNGSGFLVKDCDFGQNRSRGILIKASDGEITGNRLEACRMSAILVAPEYWWLESGSSSRLKIAGNTIINCGRTAISIEATAGNGKLAPPGAHRDIAITGNTITGGSLPNIHVVGTDGLVIENNLFQSPGFTRESRNQDPIRLDGCANTAIRDNSSL